MCFYIRDGQKERIAKKDIVCWKIVTLLKKGTNQYGEWFKVKSRFQDFIYASNKKYSIKGFEIKSSYFFHQFLSTFCIDEGFHSYSNLGRARRINRSCLVRCIIPKGSKYYYDPKYKEYVSNKIIIKEIIK